MIDGDTYLPIYVAVMSAGAASIASSSADVNISSSNSISSSGGGSVMTPSWLAAGCRLVLDPVLAMKLVAAHDSLRHVAAVSLPSTTSHDLSTSSAVTSAVTLTS